MENGINKKGFFDLKVEPHLRPISDLGIGFYNLDENTATLRFQLSNSAGALLISDNNLKVYGYFKSSNGSASDVIELNIVDEMNGVVEITLDQDFLHASTSTKVVGQVYIGVKNVSGKPEYNEVAVLGEFDFEVKDALINKISSFTKIEYIRMFSQLKEKIEKEVQDIQDAIANGADYVAEMKTEREQGIAQINQTVTDGKAYIDSVLSEVNQVSTDSVKQMRDETEKVISDISKGTTDVINYIEDKKEELNEIIENNGFITPDELEELEWQKYKLLEDNGVLEGTSLSNDLEALHSLDTGFYYRTAVPIDNFEVSSKAGFLTVMQNSFVKHITFRPYNSKRQFLKRFYNSWNDWEEITSDNNMITVPVNTDMLSLKAGKYESSRFINDPLDNASFYEVTVTESAQGRKVIHAIHSHFNRYFIKTIHTDGVDRGWKELTPNQEDTGWVPFSLINGAKSNVAYKKTGEDGFDCSYRTIVNGTETKKMVRLNGNNFAHGQQIASLPSGFCKSAQRYLIGTPRTRSGGLITILPDGRVTFDAMPGEYSNWLETDYIYGQFEWTE